MGFIKQLKETAVSVLPIAIIAAIAGLGLNVFSTDGVSFVEFIFSVILVVLGLTIFLLGVDVGLIPVGNQIGAKVTRKKNVVLLLLTGFFLGAIITVAEPDVQVLAKQVNEINSEISVSLLTMMICIGVGLFVAISFLRSIMNWSLKITLSISVVLLFIVAAFNREFFVSVAFDAGGATTGPMAVPFIMALGLGISKSKNDGEDSSFGYTGIASIGPVLFVLILGLVFNGHLNTEISSSSENVSNISLFLSVLKEVSVALFPLAIICILMQVFVMKMPRFQAARMFIGLFYTYLGLILFLFSVNCFFMPTARAIGGALADSSKSGLCLVAFLLGASVVLAEPAIWVLTKEVEEVTEGHIKRKVMFSAMCIGVALAALLSMVRILNSLSIWFFILPGYLIILALMPRTPTLFAGIAFDSGGVATGPMSSTFLLPFAIGAATSIGGDIATASFGMIGLIAMTPILCIEILGIIYARALRKKEAE